MFEFTKIVDNGYANLLKDPTAHGCTQLNNLTSHPLLVGQDTGISALTGGVQTQMMSELSQINVKLPMVGAAESLSKRMLSGEGIVPGTNGGQAVDGPFAFVKQVPGLLTNLQAQIQHLLDNAPPTPPPDPNAPPGTPDPVNPVVAEIKALVSSAASTVTSVVATASSAFTELQGNLKNFAFASYLSSFKSPAMDEMVKQVVDVPKTLAVEKQIITKRTAAAAGSVIPRQIVAPTSPDIVLAPAPQPAPQPPSPTNEAAQREAVLDAADKREIALAKKAEVMRQLDIWTAWQKDHNYQEIKAKAKAPDATPAEKDEYLKLRAIAEPTVYADYMKAYNEYQEASKIYYTALDKTNANFG